MGWKAVQEVFKHWKILRGDKVMIVVGKDKGQTGTVTRVIRKDNHIIIEGRNLVKKHIKRTEGNPGGIVTMEAPIHVSNVQHIDPVTGSPCRVTYRFLEDGTKVRVTAGKLASGSIIPRPEILKLRKKPRSAEGIARQLICFYASSIKAESFDSTF
ncbi:hypothetical protein O6H91_23G040600 [Diphasiastrum complanatum]|uniref:Uncharacterized protein n=1 Tax=Diphasiastrum complanatum TaxID=34168 RepID=A0ACC2A9Z7_DIPCM|nr:hypothetical protein O6H91_23G040600 [Diphasiastrum complanatum]